MRRLPLTIPTILGILISIAGLAVGLWFLREPIRTAVFADSESGPQQVRITNITDAGFSVSWITAKATGGYIQYGKGAKPPDLVVSDDRDQEQGQVGNYFTHLVTVRNLQPATTYSFRIGSTDNLYQVTTALTLGHPPPADVAYGQVNAASGEPAEGAVVYLSLPGVVPQAALISASGSWVIPLSTARTSDLTNWAAYDLQSTTVDITVAAGPLGNASATATTGQDSPVPLITLGQTHDFTARAGAEERSLEESKLTVTDLGQSTNTLVLLSPRSAEEVNSSQPQIIGRGPANAEVTITIQSPATITDTILTDANGEFSYSVPQDLPPGEHTVTISTVVAGVVKKVQRKFTVLASGESTVPTFTASPAATLKPRVAMPATQSGVPTSGNLTPTLILLILGIGLIASGIFTYKKLV